MLEEELTFANELADRAAKIGLRWFRAAGLEVRRKADRTPVTQADVEIESMVREAVSDRFPDDGILGEEQGGAGTGRRIWVLDPIDGTKNFADGVQVWGTLIALVVDGRVELGVVSAPALDERYEAVLGAGARLNGRPIHVSETDRLEDASLGFTELQEWLDGAYREPFLDLARLVRRTRSLGDFWGHMLVARGACDLMLEPELATWDWAAVQVVVEEAGGRTTTFDGSPPIDRGSFVSTNALLHEAIVARLSPAGP